MRNDDIRAAIETSRLRYWQVAQAYGCTDSSFSRILRRELSQELKDKIFSIIKQLKAEREERND